MVRVVAALLLLAMTPALVAVPVGHPEPPTPDAAERKPPPARAPAAGAPPAGKPPPARKPPRRPRRRRPSPVPYAQARDPAARALPSPVDRYHDEEPLSSLRPATL